MSGKPGRSGRRKNITNSIRDTLEAEDYNLVIYLDNLWEIACDKTKSPRDRLEAAKYQIDRELGRTKTTTDLSVGRTITTKIKKKASSTPIKPLMKLCNKIEIKPPITAIQSFLQLNKNKSFNFI